MPALINTVIMTLLSLLIAVPFGIFSAIFLVEYAERGNKFVEVIRLTTETLQGIPSIVYGLFGMLFFVTTCGWGFSILAGAFTLSIMVLPLIMRSTEEALESSSGFLQRRKLWTWSRKTPYRIPYRASVSSSWNPGRCDPGDRTYRRRDGSTDLYSRNGCTGTKSVLVPDGHWQFICISLSSEGLYMNQAYATAVILLVLVVADQYLSGMVAKKLTKA